jgi:hypothetical protein
MNSISGVAYYVAQAMLRRTILWATPNLFRELLKSTLTVKTTIH